VALGRRGKRCDWESEQTKRVPNELVVVHAHTEGVRTIATRRFEETPAGTRLATELEYRVELPWPQKALTPLIEFQWRRPMRKQLRALLSVVKGRIEAGGGETAYECRRSAAFNSLATARASPAERVITRHVSSPASVPTI